MHTNLRATINYKFFICCNTKTYLCSHDHNMMFVERTALDLNNEKADKIQMCFVIPYDYSTVRIKGYVNVLISKVSGKPL